MFTADFDDDLLSLLAVDVEESTNQTRTRPKFWMKPTSSRQKDSTTTSDMDTAHIGSQPAIEEQLVPGRMEGKAEERPKSRRGHLQLLEEPSKAAATTSIASGGGFGVDILKLDHSPESKVESGTKRMGLGGKVERGCETRRRVEKRDTHSSSGVEFGDEDDDMLIEMGLSDTDMPPRLKRFDHQSQKNVPSSKSEPLDQLKMMSGELTQATKGSEITSGRNKEREDGKDEESYAFGGYLPSVASGPRQGGLLNNKARSGRHLDAGFHTTRQGFDTESETGGLMRATHKPRQSISEKQQKQGPVEDTGSTKKFVRFADEVESEDIVPSNNTNTSSQSEPERPHNPLLSAQGVSREGKGEGENEVLEKNNELVQTKEPRDGEEGDLSKEVKQGTHENRLEHPVFPWQQKKRNRGLVDGHNVANPLHTEGLTLGSKHNITALEPSPLKGAEERQNIHTSDAFSAKTQILPERQREEQEKQPKQVGVKFQERQHNFEYESEKERTQNEVRACTTSYISRS